VGAQVALGLKPGVTVEEFRQAITGVQAEQLLNWVDVQRGDMLYVAAGTVHTIGGGLVLLETQQASDLTYRLYDYGRPRELHIEEGLAAIKLHSDAGKVIQDDPRFVVRSPFFQVERMRLRDELSANMTTDSPHIIVAVDGAGMLESALRAEMLSWCQPVCQDIVCVRSGSWRLCACRCRPRR
jgi:mannose-6-phosphate isomerase